MGEEIDVGAVLRVRVRELCTEARVNALADGHEAQAWLHRMAVDTAVLLNKCQGPMAMAEKCMELRWYIDRMLEELGVDPEPPEGT